jgi:UDP-N-acetylglucosamine:LPS N-acetylglucosamine transferase
MSKNVAIFSTYHGHKSIAQAMSEHLEDHGYKTITHTHPGMVLSYYVIIYKFLPFLNIVPFIVFKSELLQSISEKVLRKKHYDEVMGVVKENNISIIINNFWSFKPAADKVAVEMNLPYLNIVTDTWSSHPFIASDAADSNLAFDKKTIEAINPRQEKIKTDIVGWFVRKEFEEDFNKEDIRKKIKINPKKLTFLFSAGSEGNEKMLSVISKIVKKDFDIQIIAACGRNKELFEKIKNLKTKGLKNTELLVIPFTKEISKYMKSADLIVGKAGPNSVFEAIATESPFFALSHISGQEDGNLEIIKNKKLGFVEENSTKAVKLLEKIILNPKMLDAFGPNIKDMKKYNQQSKEKLLKIIQKLEKSKLSEK